MRLLDKHHESAVEPPADQVFFSNSLKSMWRNKPPGIPRNEPQTISAWESTHRRNNRHWGLAPEQVNPARAARRCRPAEAPPEGGRGPGAERP